MHVDATLRIALAALALAMSIFTPAVSVAAERPSTEQKRCAAGERRVARHREGLEAIDARLSADRAARNACATPRACKRLDREIKSEEARRTRVARQLAQYEDEARRICAAPGAP